MEERRKSNGHAPDWRTAFTLVITLTLMQVGMASQGKFVYSLCINGIHSPMAKNFRFLKFCFPHNCNQNVTFFNCIERNNVAHLKSSEFHKSNTTQH